MNLPKSKLFHALSVAAASLMLRTSYGPAGKGQAVEYTS